MLANIAEINANARIVKKMPEKNLIPAAPTLEEQRKARFKTFAKLWVSTAKLNSTAYAEPDENDVSMAFTDLSAYSIEEIKTALAKFRKMPERRLTPAIIETIIMGISWLTPAEAWEIAQKTFCDNVSVVLTDEIAHAANHAKKLYFDNQRVAAKDDFIAVYNRKMLDAVSISKKPHWFLMQADDCVNRESENKRAITEAMQNGYISEHKAMQLAKLFGVGVKASIKNLIAAAPDDETRQRIRGLRKLFIEDGKDGR